jgi:hypothetical protein
VTARSKDASQIKFSRCLGDEKLQNKYLKKKTIFQKSWVAERCKTKKLRENQKKQKNNFPEVLEMEEVRQETQNIVFFGFFGFFGFSKVF